MVDFDDIRRIHQGSAEEAAGMVAEAEKQMLELDSEILDLHKKLSQLQAKKSRLQAFTSYHSNLSTSIARLPAETLLEVFTHLLSESGVHIGCRAPLSADRPSVFELSAVCFWWRNVILSHPLFWSKVTLSLPRSETSIRPRILDIMYANSLARLNICYRRSGDTLMTLTLRTQGEPPFGTQRKLNALLRRLSFGHRRWERIRMSDKLLDVSRWMGHVGFPNLRVLEITHYGLHEALIRALGTLGSKAPQPRTLSLAVDAVDWVNDTSESTAFDLLSLVPTQATELNITVLRLSSGTHAALYDMIKQRSELSKLQVHVRGTYWYPRSLLHTDATKFLPFLLPTLTTLDLSWTPVGEITSVLFKLIPPNLQHLTLHMTSVEGLDSDVSEGLLGWAKHFATSLKSATFISTTASSSIVLPLIDTWTGLTKLDFQGLGTSRIFRYLSEKLPASGEFAHAPNLKELAVDLGDNAREAFLSMMSQRVAGDTPKGSRLALVTIEATAQLIELIRDELLSLVQVSNYTTRIQYGTQYQPWFSLGYDQPLPLDLPTSFD